MPSMIFFTKFIYLRKSTVVATIILPMLWLLWSCSAGLNPPPTPSSSEDEEIKNTRNILTNTCAHPDSYNNPSCRKLEFKCTILKNEHVDKPQYISADKAPSCKAGLNAKAEGDSDKYRWTIKFTPKGDEDYNRQFRYIITNRNDIPAALIHLPENSSSSKMDFDIDLNINSTTYGESTTKKICLEGAEWGREVDPNGDDDVCSSSSRKDVKDWLKDSDNSRGVIKIDIQDVTYCFTQNTKNRDVPSSQSDCSDPQAGSFRSQRIEINYDLNCKRDDLLRSVGGVALDALSAWTPWLRGVGSDEAKKQVFGCK